MRSLYDIRARERALADERHEKIDEFNTLVERASNGDKIALLVMRDMFIAEIQK